MEHAINLAMTPQERLIEPAELKKLSVLRPFRFVFDLCFDFAVIAAAITLNETFFFNPFVYAIVAVLIGSRLNAFTILMHDAAHYRAFKNKMLNHIVGEPLGWLVLFTMSSYRTHHVPHHNNLNTLDDPDWARKIPQKSYHYPKTRKAFFLDILKHVSGVGYVRLAMDLGSTKFFHKLSPKIKAMRLAFYLTLVTVCALTHTLYWLALYWIIPLVTVFSTVLWLRSLAEHYNLEYDHPYNYARTMIVPWYEAFILSPHNINYHIEHHLYPNVPYYNLHRLHNILMKNSGYAAKAHITHGVLTGLLKEMLGKPLGPSFSQMVAWQKAQAAL